MNDIIGFGEPSRRATTRNGNFFARFTTTPVKGGCEITIEALKGLVFDDGSNVKTLKLRKNFEPRPGQRVMIDGTLVKVGEVKRENGKILVQDSERGGWLQWKR